MATEQGRDTRVKIKSGAAFVPIGGETTFSYKRNSADLDTSDKDGGKGTYGQTNISISVSGNLKLPDPGLVALEAASKANPPEVEVEISKGGVTRFQGLVAVGNFSAEFPVGVATWSADMKNADTPEIDNLTGVAAGGAGAGA
ncbi:phage tail tube protein [Sphingomonas sp. 3-13AW]|uniref:phage tail tube protein n=1 Tax=Sphingomonas sp. 3-13AW TaxID=3050450 RepID=UPI003BB69864